MMPGKTLSGGEAVDLVCVALLQDAQSDEPQQEMFPPCSEAALDALDREVRQEFGVSLADGYKRLLRQTDGVRLQDIEIYGSTRRRRAFVAPPPDSNDPAVFVSGLVAVNHTLRDGNPWLKPYLIYGETEDDWLVFNPATQRFEHRQKVGMDCFDTFGTFEQLLWWAIARRLPLPPIRFPDGK